MDMQGNRQLAITQQQAWEALNDPAVIQSCIPGCDKMEASGENQYAVALALKIGPIAARFTGKISLNDIVVPSSYTIAFDGQGGVAGFGKGTAQIKLLANPQGCELGYLVHASVGGKVAQLGQRLIDGAAKSMAEDFFKRFDEAMQKKYPQAYAARVAASETPAPSAASGLPAWIWIAGLIVLGIGFWVLRSFG
ncbi:MAG: carbon monoxide dehydrogenase subunit G [Rhodoferax sp.]|uniref:CoxG family protein n=1 Tax=Rhodoferax sp. TaxID=50421 RepID=UPI00262DA474|nr:carbon monoxide dehydrogenase subunit G [Rhodoferax sp.]MDD5334099.1 carbon monoxide dehydrogenase subunit G [Rhodoferax sp.]